MLETLAGRLKWERTGNGIRVVIPVRVPWLSAFFGIILFTLPINILKILSGYSVITVPSSFVPYWIGLGIGLFLGVLWFTWVFNIKHVLTLNPAVMTIQVCFFGIVVKKYTCAISGLHNLRFGPSGYGDFASMNAMSRIEIDRDFKTRKFALGITEQEADALIEKMMEVYKFPKYPKTDTAAPVPSD